MQISKSTVPIIDSNPVRNLLERMSLTGVPSYIECRPEASSDRTYCFQNVEKKVLTHGGRSVIGWAIWLLPKIIVEAEFHSIWENPEGERIDLTPRGFDRILFIEDPSRTYEGFQVNNVRIPLYNFEPIREFISLENKKFEILNAGKRKYQHDEIKIFQYEDDEMKAMEIYKGILSIKILTYTPSPNSPCNCGSGKKYKKCCRI